MPSKRNPAPVPPEPAERAATGVTDPDPATVDPSEDEVMIATPEAEAAYDAAYPPPLVVSDDEIARFTAVPLTASVAEGTATRSPNPLAGKKTYRARQAVMVDGVRVRRGELAQLSPTSGLARSAFMVLVEDEDDVPPAVAAALHEAEDG